MTLFEESDSGAPTPSGRTRRSARVGTIALLLASTIFLVMAFLPSAYVIERPGPVFDTLGTAENTEGATTPLISVEGAPTYPTEGTLELLTVQVMGDRSRTPSWFELALAWFNPSLAVVPIDAVYPTGQSQEQRSQRNTALMRSSQQEAKAAALRHLGYDVRSIVRVQDVLPGSGADGILRAGDTIATIAGAPVVAGEDVVAAVAAAGATPVSLGIVRDGASLTVEVTPEWSEEAGRDVLGIGLEQTYDFPIDVEIQLDNVGGPSAGLMFALGIVDLLTPGALNGGARVAGTGTIDAEGAVGGIGGIRQKMYGAVGAGAEYFLAPLRNCDEVVGHVPGGLRVFAVSTLDDAETAVQAIAGGGDLDALPTCTAP